ncbi:MAG: hypothetical protein ABSB70_04500 [Candidatus Velthaea sp.]
MNPNARSRPSFAMAMWRLRTAEPIAKLPGESVAPERIARYAKLLGDAGIPLEPKDVERYRELHEKHRDLASNPDLYARESIGVAALADLHRAPDSRRMPAMDPDTLESEMDERARAKVAPPLARADVAPPARAEDLPTPTLLRVQEGAKPEISLNTDFVGRGMIVKMDDSHVTQQSGNTTYTYRTADLRAAGDMQRLETAMRDGLPVQIRRQDGRVQVDVARKRPPIDESRHVDVARQRPSSDESRHVDVARQRPSIDDPLPPPPEVDEREKAPERLDLSGKERFALKGRFVVKPQAERRPGESGLAFRDDASGNELHLTKEQLPKVIKNAKADQIISENLQQGSDAASIHLSYFKGSWNVAHVNQVVRMHK